MEQDKFILKGLDSLPSTDIRRDDCLYGVGDLTTRDLLNILDNLPYGLFITNKDQKIIYYNAAAEYISGVPIVEAMGKSCFEVFRSDICNSNCTINQINHNGGLMRSREFDIKRPDGNKVPVFCTTSLVPSRDGSANHIAYVFRDIADRRRLESDLRLVENRYQRIFEDSKDMIFVIDCQGMIKDANQACLDVLEYLSKPELMSLSVEQLFFNPMHWNVFRKQIDRYGSIRDF
jgi:PAS domain S-box-containing protein